MNKGKSGQPLTHKHSALRGKIYFEIDNLQITAPRRLLIWSEHIELNGVTTDKYRIWRVTSNGRMYRNLLEKLNWRNETEVIQS